MDHGIFYEFIDSSKFLAGNYNRLSLEDVELNKDYVLISVIVILLVLILTQNLELYDKQMISTILL